MERILDIRAEERGRTVAMQRHAVERVRDHVQDGVVERYAPPVGQGRWRGTSEGPR